MSRITDRSGRPDTQLEFKTYQMLFLMASLAFAYLAALVGSPKMIDWQQLVIVLTIMVVAFAAARYWWSNTFSNFKTLIMSLLAFGLAAGLAMFALWSSELRLETVWSSLFIAVGLLLLSINAPQRAQKLFNSPVDPFGSLSSIKTSPA